jgi:hypothetical protein
MPVESVKVALKPSNFFEVRHRPIFLCFPSPRFYLTGSNSFSLGLKEKSRARCTGQEGRRIEGRLRSAHQRQWCAIGRPATARKELYVFLPSSTPFILIDWLTFHREQAVPLNTQRETESKLSATVYELEDGLNSQG